MKINRILFLLTVIIACFQNFTGDNSAQAQERRPIDSEHPLWLVHIDVWKKADPHEDN
ncbi:Glycosyl hydrolase family 98 [Bacteroidales bacterium KHT7]|nr:Glycosyl hydrolase family 98 [Bacteroidales bacterium KHT7]